MAEARPAPAPVADGASGLPEHVTTPLLALVTARSMDEDYAHVAQQRAAAGDVRPKVARPHWSSVLAVAALGAMTAVVAVQTAREAPANEMGRAALIEQIDVRGDQVRNLQAEVGRLTRSNAAVASSSTKIRGQLDEIAPRVRRAELLTGFSAAHGPGVRITVDNAPGADVDSEIRDEDLATLVDGLFQAGAEAIAINDQRLNALGAIRNTNRAVHVNGRPVNAPYVVSVIGDPRTLQARLVETSQGQQWFGLVNGLGFVYEAQNVDDVSLPAAPERALRDVIELSADPDGAPEGGGSSP
ncbi:DUF881 domain-containing protein [Nocardioides sp. zg-1228]|uniref:DUF881 domain-containing protein n=1 Tax=Nocardioides sp. zg-1228 TaxID=2763008 RepID=UPI001642E11F|nr:DUF881 domain-containing protein [Nocardioides sp. zg-1228]MBC2934681.1 DUF881 domain-containing protein [Nocardioides sp. zg-1228]QSF56000.1 DUF881 domain-containing protein [Nocardioides sp. zg-1228]